MKTKCNWDEDLKTALSNGVMQVQYTGGDAAKRFAKIVPEPGRPKNHVLQYWLDDSWPASEGEVKARIQTNLYGIKPGLKEFYQSVRIFLPADVAVLQKYSFKISWLTISEFWNNEWWVAAEKHGFRITLGIGKPKQPVAIYILFSTWKILFIKKPGMRMAGK